MNPVIILTLHHISVNPDNLTVPPKIFERLLQNLSKTHHFISHEKFCRYLFEHEPLPKNSILLTFDDGYLDNFIYAYPLLKKYNIPAIIFTVTGMNQISGSCRTTMPGFKPHKTLERTPDPEYFINKAEISEMESSGLVSVHSHTVSHLSCRKQTKEKVRQEMMESLKFIQEHCQSKSHYAFCWPKGHHDQTSIEVIKETPYDHAYSTIDGAYIRGTDPFLIRRIDISSFRENEKEYFRRIRKKLLIYGTPILSKLYSDLREWGMRKKRAWKQKR